MTMGPAGKAGMANILQGLSFAVQLIILVLLLRKPTTEVITSIDLSDDTSEETPQNKVQMQQAAQTDQICNRNGCIRPEFEGYHGGLLKTNSMFQGGALQYPVDICEQAETSPDRMPFMMDARIQSLFKKYVNEDTNYLEWGTGGSTQQFYDKVKHMTSIENNPDWCDQMMKNKHVQCGQSNGQLDFICTTRNAEVGYFGTPQKKHTGYYNYHKYVNIIDYLPSEFYDVVLVDGRFRVACAIKALPYIRPGTGVLAIHDYERQHYHNIEQYYDKVEEVVAAETFAIFKPKENIPEAQYDDYLLYLNDHQR
ncbi:hypothetical protein SARC_11515 [Sphaeroforma arctica JP610]|uniref:Methyltransferase n=1 Tax=Sphaeroforma arctica JP610 TaxID=667725 RepID=A0A0L0FGT5_9EUKA|nr:hypothetical protein SARC_11515 [Sphaeroforma arctica JP610]KNC75970.1 hypothetical protein SARC_11515 [Sphaeroforma arctica JP610]|eukprot:XP_014149872.1 hypothetical protein SARC_11515 [Sphaeroforma arctica JP610]